MGCFINNHPQTFEFECLASTDFTKPWYTYRFTLPQFLFHLRIKTQCHAPKMAPISIKNNTWYPELMAQSFSDLPSYW